jgi:hypothetical protein
MDYVMVGGVILRANLINIGEKTGLAVEFRFSVVY